MNSSTFLLQAWKYTQNDLCLNLFFLFSFVLDVFAQKNIKTSIEDHKPNIWLGLGLIHVVSIQLLFFWWCLQPPVTSRKLLRLIITRDKTHVQGRIFFCREKTMGWLTCIQLAYRQERVHPQSKDSCKSFTFGDVWCEWWVWVEPWIPQWPWLSFLVHSRKENDSKSQVFSNVFLEFPDIFVTAPPESCVHVLVQQIC